MPPFDFEQNYQFLIAVPLRRGRCKSRAIKEKKHIKKNNWDGEVPTAIKHEMGGKGGGVKALVALPLKKKTFFL